MQKACCRQWRSGWGRALVYAAPPLTTHTPMEPINWILFAIFFVIVIWKLFVQRRDAKAARKKDASDAHRP